MGSNIILLVEDSADDAELTSRALRRGNVLNEIVLVRDGVKALDYLLGRRGDGGQEPNGAPALIGSPRASQTSTRSGRLRAEERTRRIPVMILSGSSDERDVVSSHDLGANRFIVKPIDVMQFAAVARQLGLHRLVAAVDDIA